MTLGSIGLTNVPSRPQEAPIDWGQMANAFDRFVMDPANGVIFEDGQGHRAFTAFLEGRTGPDANHELVSYGPITLGKYLLGHDVTTLLPTLAGYFNETIGVTMNTPRETRIEMWYLMYANSLAAHITRRALGSDAAARARLRRSVDTLQAMARTIDYDFNHQGYDFATRSAWTRKDIYRQPDAVGGYAYLMLLAHEMLGDPGYLEEARRALSLYLAFEANPWYEVPSGAMAALAAARLHALGFEANVARAIDYVLDPAAGMVVGSWGGREAHGLFRGWRHSQPESAYSMESLVVLPYLLPIVRYDVRFARTIAKYALHVAANARLFYSDFMRGSESRGDLSPAVPYERVYESYEGHSPYAAGDCPGHKSIYGGGYALSWGALARPTDDPYILQLDVARSDFLAQRPYPTYLYANPWETPRTVHLDVGSAPVSLYDLALHAIVAERVVGRVPIELHADSARVIALVPPGGKQVRERGRLAIDGVVVDYRAAGGA
ncbi:MAG: hypothetical protein ACYCYF_13745 [Anaerolineae bacterium]